MLRLPQPSYNSLSDVQSLADLERIAASIISPVLIHKQAVAEHE